MINFKETGLCIIVVVTFYIAIATKVFNDVYLTSKLIVDEEFHLVLGEAYCKFDYNKWHPKVTTFPGLYLLSSLLWGPFELCSTYWLRATSLLFSCLNTVWKNAISSLTLGLFPPLFFFSNVYYTDVASLTMILLLFLTSQTRHHFLASIFGFCAVLFRQTNIIWVGMVFARYILQEMNIVIHRKSWKSGKDGVPLKEFGGLLTAILRNPKDTLLKTSFNFWLNAGCYGSLLLFFAVFILLNGSIVVGDKTAHEATIHIPQMFYFGLFTLFFAWPYFFDECLTFYRLLKTRCLIFSALGVMAVIIVYFNTLVHPYMLADNRHYVFYIWSRFYGRFILFRYLIIPFYLFSWYVIIKKLYNNKDVTFLLMYILCTFVALVTQRLLEFRYFFVSYVLFRTQLKNTTFLQVIAELLSYVIVNIFILHLFHTKTIYWDNYDLPQRLIW